MQIKVAEEIYHHFTDLTVCGFYKIICFEEDINKDMAVKLDKTIKYNTL